MQGASSDCLAFEVDDLYTWLENGLLHQDRDHNRFVLFGDNAYLNTAYMATPFTNVAGNPNHARQFHSQLQIQAECTFGMMVQRWGLLQMVMPRNIDMWKIVALVIALAKVHNFCIGKSIVPQQLP